MPLYKFYSENNFNSGLKPYASRIAFFISHTKPILLYNMYKHKHKTLQVHGDSAKMPFDPQIDPRTITSWISVGELPIRRWCDIKQLENRNQIQEEHCRAEIPTDAFPVSCRKSNEVSSRLMLWRQKLSTII